MTEAITQDHSETKSEPQVGMKKANRTAAVVLFLFAGYIVFGALQMSLADEYGPGPGLFPLGLGIILGILAAALFIENANPKKKDKASPFVEVQGLTLAGLVMAGLVGYVLLVTHMGYVLTTLLFVLFLMLVVQRDKARTGIITAVVVAAMLYLIFEVGLGVRLPKGPFGF